MILTGLLKKLKWIIVLVVIITIIYWIVRLWKWKPLLKEMISKEISLAEAVSRFSRGDSSSQSEPSSKTSDETTDDQNENDDFSYLARRTSEFFSGPKRHKVRTSNQESQSIPQAETTDDEETLDEPKHKGRDPVRRTNSKVSKYKREEICRKILEDHFDDYFPTCRPRFLANPKTGYPLELDGYNPRLNLAFEHQGVQHRIFPNPFHKTEAEFDAQLEKDKFKRERLAELGIDLVEIWDDVPTAMIKPFIISELKRLRGS